MTITLETTSEGFKATLDAFPVIQGKGSCPQAALEQLTDAVDDYLWRRYTRATWSDSDEQLLTDWIIGEDSLFSTKEVWVKHNQREDFKVASVNIIKAQCSNSFQSISDLELWTWIPRYTWDDPKGKWEDFHLLAYLAFDREGNTASDWLSYVAALKPSEKEIDFWIETEVLPPDYKKIMGDLEEQGQELLEELGYN
jgi:hypothetical protein